MNIQPSSVSSTSDVGGAQTSGPISNKQDLKQIRQALKQSLEEQFQPEQFQQIDAAWKSNPDVRAGVLEEARQLLSDPNYPSPTQLSMLAKMIVGQDVPMPPQPMPPTIEPPTPVSTDPPVSTTPDSPVTLS